MTEDHVTGGVHDAADLVNSEEAARILGVSRRTVQRLANTGEIPVVAKIGRRGEYLFNALDIEAHKSS